MRQISRRHLHFVAVVGIAAFAPFPSAAQEEERPDFSGVWTVYIAPGENPGFSFGPTEEPPFTPEGKRRFDEYRKLVGITGEPLVGENPGAYCVPYGMPSMMEQAGFYPIEFIQRPEQLTIIYEVEGETRRVYFGDRNIPKEDRLPSRQGYSSGEWDGETLVVTTTDMTDSVDQMTHPHSDQAEIVERFNMGEGAQGEPVISYEMTLTDPVYYTEPVHVSKKWTPLPNGRIMAYNCTEEPWLRLLEARKEQLDAGEPLTVKMKDVIEVYEN